MKFEDRIQALKRSLKYRRDYKKYDEYREKHGIEDIYLMNSIAPLRNVSPRGQKLCQKYDIPNPFNPDEDFQVLPGNQIIPLAKGIKIPAVLSVPLKKKKTGEQVFGLKDVRYLRADIDITRNLKDIKKSISDLYHYYSKQIKEDKRNTVIDLPKGITIWNVYDMKHSHNKTTIQIVKDVFKIKDSPSYNKVAKSKRSKIDRAIKKAKDLIHEIEQ